MERLTVDKIQVTPSFNPNKILDSFTDANSIVQGKGVPVLN
jgi:hypothetical protein